MTIVWFDFETRSPVNLKKEGGYRYAAHPETDILCLSWALDDGPVTVWSPEWCHPDRFVKDEHRALSDLATAMRGPPMIFAAFNAAFDREIWNKVFVRLYDMPELRIEQVIDVQAQTEGSGCPPGLGATCEALGTEFKKNKEGAQLIKWLCNGTRESWEDTPETRERMRRMRLYARDDVVAMRAAFKASRLLTTDEWDTYHAHEQINARGVCVDVEFAQAAKKYAAEEKAEINDALQAISGDTGMSVSTHTRNSKFAHSLIADSYPEIAGLLERDPDPKTGKERFSLDEATRSAAFAALDQPEYLDLDDEKLDTFRTFLETVEAGNSAAVHKYKALVDRTSDDGRLRGMYAYNGGGQTGRSSSRGAQLHNLIKEGLYNDDVLDKLGIPKDERLKFAANAMVDLKDAIVAGDTAEIDRILEPTGLSVTRSLGRLLRPTFIAAEGKTFVWADWRSIEWVVLPWLSGSAGGRKRLDAFRAGLDPYRLSAAGMYNVPYESVPKEDPRRQEGKIAELSLGFLGGAGALMGMAKKYGRKYTRDRAQEIVDAWRRANTWAVIFGNDCMDAARNAIRNPRAWIPVGRISYMFAPKLMKGTLLCKLPCGRLIQYPEIKIVRIVLESGKSREEITYRKSWGKTTVRNSLWRGICVENATQGTANSLLRLAIQRFRDVAVFHTHDELGIEVPVDEAAEWEAKLREGMEHVPPWANGLPIQVTTCVAPFYFKD